jgi:hypothetical protein
VNPPFPEITIETTAYTIFAKDTLALTIAVAVPSTVGDQNCPTVPALTKTNIDVEYFWTTCTRNEVATTHDTRLIVNNLSPNFIEIKST